MMSGNADEVGALLNAMLEAQEQKEEVSDAASNSSGVSISTEAGLQTDSQNEPCRLKNCEKFDRQLFARMTGGPYSKLFLHCTPSCVVAVMTLCVQLSEMVGLVSLFFGICRCTSKLAFS